MGGKVKHWPVSPNKLFRNERSASARLSRAVCRFRLYRAAPGLSRAQIDRAARTHAEAHAPFDDTGAILLRSPHGAEIWYWDKAQSGAGVPESLDWGIGEGWRVLVCAEGFEAQYWEAGGLVASSWRRQQFTRDQWAAFVLGVEGIDPPAAPPSPETVTRTRNWKRRQIKPPLSWRDGETMAFSVALCATALAAFFAAQGMRYEGIARAEVAQAAVIEASIAADPALARARERVQLLREFDRAGGDGEGLAALVDALAVFKTFNLEAQGWRVDDDGFRAALNASMADVPLREVVAALEASPRLCGVEPNLSSREGALELTAKIEGGGSRCGGPGARP
jgi:hypothetical protein